MPERMSSFFILLGGAVAVIALWVISVMAVNWDTRRRRVTELERKAWVAVAIVLPLFGFALYLFMRVLRRYLTPQQPEPQENGPMTYVRPRQNVAPRQPVWNGGSHAGGSRAGGSPAGGSSSADGGNGSMAWSTRANAGPRQTPATVAAANQPLPATYSLVVLEGPHLGQQFILNRLPARIGRGVDAAVPLDADLNVSRNHAEIYAWNGALRIRDLRSTHGTLVNGTLVSDQPVRPGDRISTGGTVLMLKDTQSQ